MCRLAREGGGEACPRPPAPAVAYRVEFGRTSAPGARALGAGLDGGARDFLGRQVGALVADPGAGRVAYYATRGALAAAWALVLSLWQRR